MSSYIKLATSYLNPEEVKEKEWYEEMETEICELFPTLTYQQRIIGVISFIGFGFLLSMGSLLRLVQLLHGNPTPFAIMYSMGNIVSVSATCFLYGPYSQAKKMFAQTRIIATSVYLFFLGLTLTLAFLPNVPMRVFLLTMTILCQFIALIWYTLSFIPFARQFIRSYINSSSCCSCFHSQNDAFWNDL